MTPTLADANTLLLTMRVDALGLWHISIFLGVIILLVLGLNTYRKQIGWEAAALWGWVLFSAILIIEFPYFPFGMANRAFQATAGQTVVEAGLIPILFLLLKDSTISKLWKVFQIVALVKIVLIWVYGFCTPEIPYFTWLSEPGAVISSSFDCALLALYFPFAPWWLRVLILPTIAFHHGTTALTILAAELLAWVIAGDRPSRMRPRLAWRIGVFSGAIAVFLLLAGLHSNSHLFDGGERLGLWKKMMTYWCTMWQMQVFGIGAGSFMWISFAIDKFKMPMFQTMHNDWLQILWEYGAIGLFLAIATFIRACRNVWKDITLLMGVFGAGAFGFTYHPLQYFPSVFLLCLIFRKALYDNTK